jgi:DNA-binding transcriptional LysR family regulator
MPWGVRLLDRSPQGIEPTEYGRALLRRSGVAFDELKQAIRDVEFLANPNVGEVRIGCPESITAAILPPVIDKLIRQYPGIVPIVSEAIAPSLDFSELCARKVDLVLARLVSPLVHGQSLDDLNVEVLLDDEAVIAAGAKSQWARRRNLSLADLVNEPWILTEPNTWNHRIVAEAFTACGLAMPKISLMTLSVHVRTNLVANGPYITVLPRSVMNLYAERFSLKELRVDFPVRPWPLAVVTLKSRTLSPVVKLFIDQAETRQTANRRRDEARPQRSLAADVSENGDLKATSLPLGVGWVWVCHAHPGCGSDHAENDFGGGLKHGGVGADAVVERFGNH